MSTGWNRQTGQEDRDEPVDPPASVRAEVTAKTIQVGRDWVINAGSDEEAFGPRKSKDRWSGGPGERIGFLFLALCGVLVVFGVIVLFAVGFGARLMSPVSLKHPEPSRPVAPVDAGGPALDRDGWNDTLDFSPRGSVLVIDPAAGPSGGNGGGGFAESPACAIDLADASVAVLAVTAVGREVQVRGEVHLPGLADPAAVAECLRSLRVQVDLLCGDERLAAGSAVDVGKGSWRTSLQPLRQLPPGALVEVEAALVREGGGGRIHALRLSRRLGEDGGP